MRSAEITDRGMFGITSGEDFFQKVCADHERLAEDIADPRAAMNCILSLYHLHEWVWACCLKDNRAVREPLGIHRKKEFCEWLEKNCPHFNLMQDLANGIKHCRPICHPARQVKGFGQGPYGLGPYGTPYLLIDLGEDEERATRYLVASTVLEKILAFWRGFFVEHRVFDPPEADTDGKTPGMPRAPKERST